MRSGMLAAVDMPLDWRKHWTTEQMVKFEKNCAKRQEPSVSNVIKRDSTKPSRTKRRPAQKCGNESGIFLVQCASHYCGSKEIGLFIKKQKYRSRVASTNFGRVAFVNSEQWQKKNGGDPTQDFKARECCCVSNYLHEHHQSHHHEWGATYNHRIV